MITADPWSLFQPQQILNCTLDDIEWFVARLQKAAEAFKQLNQRKKGKKKNKKGPAGTDQSNREGAGECWGKKWWAYKAGGKNQPGREQHPRAGRTPPRTQQGPRLTTFPVSPEGVLTLRARPPTEGEFVDCFQKTKLAINLLVSQPSPVLGVRGEVVHRPTLPHAICHPLVLPTPQAKLQKHIQNPSAAELVHFLFGPLDLVTGAGTGWGQEQWSDRDGFGGGENKCPPLHTQTLGSQEATVPP